MAITPLIYSYLVYQNVVVSSVVSIESGAFYAQNSS